MMDHDHEKAAARADFCRFLAACYYEPDPVFAEEKLFDSMLQAANRIDPALTATAHRLGEHFPAESIDSLLLDYTRLFLGPTDIVANPYGCVWMSGENTLMQDSTMAVLELYEEGGFGMDEGFHDLPDHIAAELEFLYLLIHRENEARLNSDVATASAIADLRTRFLREHLARWVRPFTAAVKAGAQSPFYRQLAELTDRFVTMEASDQ